MCVITWCWRMSRFRMLLSLKLGKDLALPAVCSCCLNVQCHPGVLDVAFGSTA